MAPDRTRSLRGAVAGAVAAGVWAAQQPLDKRVFGVDYDDTVLLGTLVTRDRSRAATVPAGTVIHLVNGAAFGAIYARLAPSLPGPRTGRGVLLALGEAVATWPGMAVVAPQLFRSPAAFGQALWRHALFGAVLGELERRLNPGPAPVPPPPEDRRGASNGHGELAHVVVVQSG